MKIVRTLFALAVLSFLTSCAKEELSTMDDFVNNNTEFVDLDVTAKRNIETPRIVEVTTDVIRPHQFTTQN